MKTYALLIFLTLIAVPAYARATTVNLCVDDRNWYPFVYVNEEGLVRGIHVDIVSKALKSIGFEFTINAYPRKQCIDRVVTKEAHGMISIAYHTDIETFFQFPPGSASQRRSKWRIMQVDYMVITHISNSYRFKGDIHNLPNPIRIPRGETIASELRQLGMRIDDGARDDRRNFLKLLRDKDGAVITTSVMAERLVKELDIADQITIHAVPFKSQSYYLAFSNDLRISSADKKRLWTEITKWRDDFVFMLQLFARY